MNHFKQINDRYGHAAGDAVLRTISERLRQQVRQGDLVGRIGGDELVVVLDGISDLADALQLATTLHQQAAQPLQLEGETIVITLSVGVALASPEETPEVLLARADAAMYSAKQQGRNQVVSLEPGGGA